MRLRTFTAHDMPAAMQQVREALGEEAIILSTEKYNGHRVTVTAAIDPDQWTDDSGQKKEEPSSVIRHPSTDLRFEIQNILRFHNLPEQFTAKMTQKVTTSDLNAAHALHRISGNRDERHLHRLALEKLLAAFFDFKPLTEGAQRIMLVGTPGAGKTLTIAKMAAKLVMDKQPLTIITTDNKRAGGIEQLEAFTSILGLDLKTATSRQDLAELLKAAHPRVLIDTAGCNPYEENEMKALAAMASLENIEPVLVMPAGGDSLEAIDGLEMFSALPIRRLFATRTDTARRFGSILSAAAAHQLAFCQVSHSASIIDPLQPADAALLAQLLLRYQV